MHRIEDLRGDLHVHTAKEVCETHLGLLIDEFDEACGHVPLREVVNEARDTAGMTYLGVTNHSSDPVDPDPDPADAAIRVRSQLQTIREFCVEDHGIAIFAGSEVNILPNGDLDVADDVLEQLDYVVASMHYLDGLTPDEIRRNYLQALRRPNVKVIGHMNRYITELTDVQWGDVVEAAAAAGCALEFNVASQLTDELIHLISGVDVLITLGSDAHRHDSIKDYVAHLIGPTMDPDFLKGALMRLEKIPQERIINFWESDRVFDWLES